MPRFQLQYSWSQQNWALVWQRVQFFPPVLINFAFTSAFFGPLGNQFQDGLPGSPLRQVTIPFPFPTGLRCSRNNSQLMKWSTAHAQTT